jgi:hypothetical protein
MNLPYYLFLKKCIDSNIDVPEGIKNVKQGIPIARLGHFQQFSFFAKNDPFRDHFYQNQGKRPQPTAA